mmetsp:Transcript_18245/g.21817  ORF Transcript_18245/g.21817 Transcript_18245/m.21817 type:complete len:106 (-) Transcript_18245:669-986(-)
MPFFTSMFYFELSKYTFFSGISFSSYGLYMVFSGGIVMNFFANNIFYRVVYYHMQKHRKLFYKFSFYYMTSKKLNLAIMLDDDLLVSLSEGLLLVIPLECLQVHW